MAPQTLGDMFFGFSHMTVSIGGPESIGERATMLGFGVTSDHNTNAKWPLCVCYERYEQQTRQGFFTHARKNT